MISDVPALEVALPGGEATVANAAASRGDSLSRRTIWNMLFQMPTVAVVGASRGRRCAGCGIQVGGIDRGAATVCVFCAAWTQWRREGDERWARVLTDQGDDSGGVRADAKLVGLAART